MRILTVNGGSSSVKYALYQDDEVLESGKIDHIGLPHATFERRVGSAAPTEEGVAVADAATAVSLLALKLAEQGTLDGVKAVAHRVVHGAHFSDHTLITAAVLAELRRMAPYDPEHMPGEIALIEALTRAMPQAAHVACFDTVFHARMPAHARMLPVPRMLMERGIRRYGFHGLSYEHLYERLCMLVGNDVANGRVVMAHLGNGASLAALSSGISVDTTMAFSPNSGIPMGTRSGDIDPGIIGYLSRERGLSIDQIEALLAKESGLRGMSGITYDMYELLSREATDAHAREAVEAFCYAVRKQIGAYIAALGGIDALVFSGGMGEKSAPVRERILAGLEGLGIALDLDRNRANEPRISADDRIPIYAIPADEERTMQRIAARIAGTRMDHHS